MNESASVISEAPAVHAPHSELQHRPLPPISGRKPTHRIAWLLLVVLVLAALAALFLIGDLPRHEKALALAATTEKRVSARPRVRVATPKPVPEQTIVRLPGTIEAARSSGVFARVGGVVIARLVEIGDHAAAGQVLARIDNPDLVHQLANGEALLLLARAGVEQASVEVQRSLSDYERFSALGAKFLSLQEIDHHLADRDAAAANLHAAAGRVSAAEAEVRRLQDLVRFTEVTAPFAGTVTARNVEIGNLIPAGGGAAALFQITQIDPLRAVVDVPQASLNGIAIGLAAKVDTGPSGQTVNGSVVRLADALDAGSRAMRVEIEFPASAAAARRLRPGMRIEASLSLPPRRPLLTISADAVLLSAKGTQVAILDGHDRVHLVAVTVDGDTGTDVQIATGLTATDRVIANPGGTILEGAEVDIVQPATPAAAKGGQAAGVAASGGAVGSVRSDGASGTPAAPAAH
jgi:RND family efflux transporter MFP subunit